MSRERDQILPGPAWVGIGAQRSGTTWFTELLAQHPAIELPLSGKKELHAFDRSHLTGWSDADTEAYRDHFSTESGTKSGEFTPFYLRAPWIAPYLRRACRSDLLLLVLLRDPVDRFVSAVRWHASRAGLGDPRDQPGSWVRDKSVDAVWGGMYATQLAAWSTAFPPEQILVQQYESVVHDPQAAVGQVWEALGLDPVPLALVRAPSWTSVQDNQSWCPPDFEVLTTSLRSTYETEVSELERHWALDRTRWPNFR